MTTYITGLPKLFGVMPLACVVAPRLKTCTTSGGGTGAYGTANYNANAVDRRGLDVVSRRFKGRKITSADVMKKAGRRDLFQQRFDALNVLYAMVAMGRAQKLKERDGRSILFKILR